MEYKVINMAIRYEGKKYVKDEIITMKEEDAKELLNGKYLEVVENNNSLNETELEEIKDIKKMTLNELKEFAETNDIELMGKIKKDIEKELIEWILGN